MSWVSFEQLNNFLQLAGFRVTEDSTSDKKSEKGPTITLNRPPATPLIERAKNFTLVGRPELEQFFNEHIIDIILKKEEYQRMGITFPGATILYGPPGCGKTYAVEKLAKYLGWQRFDINASTIASPFIHDTSKKISDIFNQAIKAAPSILVIDEMEAFLSNRNLNISSSTYHIEEVAEFLKCIPEAISNEVLVFAMTNMLNAIDPAILRKGRFDHIIEVKMAGKEEIAELLTVKFKELPIANDVVVNDIAQQLDHHPMSDITFVLREAGRIAIKSRIEFINKACFEKALSMLPQEKTKRKIGFNQ